MSAWTETPKKEKREGGGGNDERILTAVARTHFQGISKKVLASGRKKLNKTKKQSRDEAKGRAHCVGEEGRRNGVSFFSFFFFFFVSFGTVSIHPFYQTKEVEE